LLLAVDEGDASSHKRNELGTRDLSPASLRGFEQLVVATVRSAV